MKRKITQWETTRLHESGIGFLDELQLGVLAMMENQANLRLSTDNTDGIKKVPVHALISKTLNERPWFNSALP